MDFALGDRAEAFRAEVRQFLADLPAGIAEDIHGTHTLHSDVVHRAMAERGWLAAAWPAEFGGQGRDPFELAVLAEEFARAGIPIEGWEIAELVARTLQIVGTEQQRAEVIPAVLRGEMLLSLGYTEPESGSDVAAARTKAVRDGDGWLIDGQKMFTTMSHVADYVFLLARTNPDVAKHQGLTMFLVPLDAPGVKIHPVYTMGERTNATFYNQVWVPDTARVGEVDRGWDVMMVALAFERQPAAAGQLLHLVEKAVDWARTPDDTGSKPCDDRVVRHTLARTAIDLEVARLLGWRMTWLSAEGAPPYTAGSMAKLFGSEALVKAADVLLDCVGAEGLPATFDADAAGGGWLDHDARHSVVTTIYAGSSEIQRDIIAQQHLKLPRARASRTG